MYYLYDLAGHVVTEINSSGGWNRGEVYAGGRHLATYVGGTTYFDQGDWLGTERARTDATGAVAETCTGLPFGDDMNCTAGGISPLYFTGKQRDTETGLDYFGARYNASNLGRFMTPDWSAKVEPVPYAKLADPQSLNLYTYVLDNPVTLTDADGHCRSRMSCMFISLLKPEQEDIPGSARPPALRPPKPPPNASQKTEFKTLDAAGVEAEKRINPTSQKQKREYAGWLVKNPNGTYSVGAPHAGTAVSSTTGPEPKSAAGDYHTHPGIPGYDSEHFSRQDKWGNIEEHLPGYLGTPTRILKYDPFTGRVTVLERIHQP